MNKEMNKVLQVIRKYDIMGGLLIFLVISFLGRPLYGLTYIYGLTIAFLNFLYGFRLVSKLTGENNLIINLIQSIIKVLIVAALSIPFMHNKVLIIMYIAGLTSHYLFMIVGLLIEGKGSA